MNKNIITILLIFLVPIAVYWSLSRDKSVTVTPSIAFSGPEIIKFSSPRYFVLWSLFKHMTKIS